MNREVADAMLVLAMGGAREL
uniref:Uncharacterized protein n=1 Tax=Arundo donax TaxID=35708 RepID=A0A0A9E8G6_ARUDO